MLDAFLHISGSLACGDVALAGSMLCDALQLTGELSHNTCEVKGSLSLGGELLPYYTDEYIVIPKVYEQNLDTDNKSMTDDVTVRAIPYSETTNPQGGKTIVIGGEL